MVNETEFLFIFSSGRWTATSARGVGVMVIPGLLVPDGNPGAKSQRKPKIIRNFGSVFTDYRLTKKGAIRGTSNVLVPFG